MTEPLGSGPRLLVRRLLESMERWRASDLFLATDRPPAVRVDGTLVRVDLSPTTSEDIRAFLDDALTPLARGRFEATGGVDVGFGLDGDRRFRLNVSRHQGGIVVVARALPTGALDLETLGLPEAVAALADLSRGLVLVTGATGSGKSTTLAAMVHRINRTRAVHVLTLEDPVEFVHRDLKARVTQREVGTDTPTFREGLRHAVRQSPDVIMVGELRDLETVRVALSAVLTGHLVLATLHTVDATQTLQRILSLFPEHARDQAAVDLSLSLEGIISQRLVPRADSSGRVLAMELVTGGPAVRRLVRERRIDDLYDLVRSARDPGMVTFNESLLQLYRQGVISLETGRTWASHPEEFSLGAQGMSVGVDGFRRRDQGDRWVGLDMKALLRVVQERGASDLHLAVGRPPILRVDGRLEPLGERPLSAADMRILLYSILSAQQRTAYELEREIDFALALDDGTRFRVNAYFQRSRMAASLRAVPSRVPDAEELMIPPGVLALGERPHGLLLVVGPTGSGKSTTLACLVDRIHRSRPCRIITVEDPIEYSHDGVLATVDQREVHADTRSFAAALKYVLRQDPDVILVGEMRDLETISAAITAAETGHLVLATLHTNDAVQAVDRIVDVFPAHQQRQVRSQLAASLLGVVSQRLLPRSGGGRIAAFEVLVATAAVRNLVRENKMHQAQSAMEAGTGDGMVTMDRALRDLVARGLVAPEDAARHMRGGARTLTP